MGRMDPPVVSLPVLPRPEPVEGSLPLRGVVEWVEGTPLIYSSTHLLIPSTPSAVVFSFCILRYGFAFCPLTFAFLQRSLFPLYPIVLVRIFGVFGSIANNYDDNIGEDNDEG